MVQKIKEQVKQYLQQHPEVKNLFLRFVFKRKPYQTQVRGFIWFFTILPWYFKRGISLKARLDLAPFNNFYIGKYAKVEKNMVINNGMGDVFIDDEVQLGVGSVIIGPVKIGRYSGLSQYVRLLGMHHGVDPTAPHHHHPCQKAPIELGEDVFIGTGTVVMGKKNGEPLTLGDYCRIGANSVVMTDIPPFSIAVGNPAKVVRRWNHLIQKWERVDDTDIADPSLERTIKYAKE